MTLKHLFPMALVTAFLIGTAGTAAAQDSHRFEVFGSLGVSNYADLFGPSSTSANFGGGIGVRPFSANHRIAHRLGLELEVDAVNEKQYSGGLLSPATYTGRQTQTLILGDILYHFSDGRTQPYIMASFGAASAPSFNVAGGLGGGVKIFVRKHVSLRPEFRILGTSRDEFSMRGSFAVGYHW